MDQSEHALGRLRRRRAAARSGVGVWGGEQGRRVASSRGWWGAGEGELVDELAGERFVVDDAEDAEAAGALGALEDVDVEGAAHEGWPVDARGRRQERAGF